MKIIISKEITARGRVLKMPQLYDHHTVTLAGDHRRYFIDDIGPEILGYPTAGDVIELTAIAIKSRNGVTTYRVRNWSVIDAAVPINTGKDVGQFNAWEQVGMQLGCFHGLIFSLKGNSRRFMINQDGWLNRRPAAGDYIVVRWERRDDAEDDDEVLVTGIDYISTEGLGVPVPLERKLMNESVAVIQKLTEPLHAVHPWAPWWLDVKHRDGGPKQYCLAFVPDPSQLIKNALVRIFWLARDTDTQKTAVALRIDIIGDVQYRD